MAVIHRRVVITWTSLVLLAALAGVSCGDDGPQDISSSKVSAHWSYEGEDGPAAWGELAAEYAACSTGSAQSPIDLGAPEEADLPDLQISYQPGEVSVTDNGHTVQATAAVNPNGAPSPAASSITLDGTTFTLVQMHFHSPSEHTINGEFAPAEVHFVHRSESGELAVIGVMLTVGTTENAAWGAYTDTLSVGEEQTVTTTLDWPAMLPTEASTIRYSGSLTTPPCTEGVRWIVMDTPVEISTAQLAAFVEAHEGNHRPVQDLYDREVLIDSTNR
jgi:carbonic anhydrase